MSEDCSTPELQLAIAGNLSPDREERLYRHLEHCEACSAAIEAMAGVNSWCPEAASLLRNDELDATLPRREEWSEVDFSVEHLEPSDAPEVLGRLGGYDVLEIIGRGGMGVVLKALDRELNRYVAIKVLAPHLANSSLAKKRFIREAQAAAAVVHPHVMAIHQVQAHGRLPFLVMPLVTGESLAQRLAAQGRLELKETLRIGMQAAAGLSAAHEQGLVHRDVKPANILLEKGVERAVLTDFGLARAADDVSLTRWGIIAGTPQYMSPEQAQGAAVDGRSDLFGLGCVLYEMATGVSPFRADTTMATLRRLIDDPPPAMASYNPELPPWFIGIVERLLEKEPSQRLASAKEVSELLEGCLAHVQQPTMVPLPAGVPSRPAGAHRPRPFAGRSGRKRILAALIGLLFFGGLGLTFGILIHLKKDGKTTTIEVPEGSTARVSAQGTVTVELPSSPAAAADAAINASADAQPNRDNRYTAPYYVEPPDVIQIRLLKPSSAAKSVDGQYLVGPDGTVNLRQYGVAHIAGKSLIEARTTLQEQLARFLQSPEISLDVVSTNSLVFYIITHGADRYGNVRRVPATGKERVFDAIANVNQLSPLSHKRIWIARPVEGDAAPDKILPVDWAAIAEHRSQETNYQLLAGDRVIIEAVPEAQSQSKVPGRPPYEARLPNGVTVELLGVSEHPSKDRPWWRPDGSPLVERPYDAVGGDSATAGKDRIIREFAVRLGNLPVEPVSTLQDVVPRLALDPGIVARKATGKDTGETTMNAGSMIWPGQNPTRRGVAVKGIQVINVDMPKVTETVTLRYGVAAEPWQTIGQRDDDQSPMMFLRNEQVVFFAPTENADGSVVVHLAFKRKLDDFAVRVVAVDSKGQEHVASKTDTPVIADLARLTATFQGLPLKRIKHFRLQTRPLYWAEFRNVALRVGQKTDVQVVVPVEALPPARLPHRHWFSAGPAYNELNRVLSTRGVRVSSYNHSAEHYRKILADSQPGATLVLLFALDHPDKNVPAEYQDLLPKPWPEIGAALKRGETVELRGQARDRHIVVLGAPTAAQLVKLIRKTKSLSVAGGVPAPGPVAERVPASESPETATTENPPFEEKDLVEMFRQYTTVTGGVFPKSLDMMTASATVWDKINVRLLWDNLQFSCETIAPESAKAINTKQHVFEEQALAIMEEIMDNAKQGKPVGDQTQKLQELVFQVMIPAFWEQLAPPQWKASKERKQEFEEQMHKAVVVKTNGQDIGDAINKIVIEMAWHNAAPEKLRENKELFRRFEDLMRRYRKEKWSEGRYEQEIRRLGGDEMLKAMKALEAQWEARAAIKPEVLEARTKKFEEREARSRKFAETQRQVQRGLMFVNQLPASAEAHYAGQGVSLGAAETPIFWYRPGDAKNYRVVYADLSVRDAVKPPSTGKTKPVAPKVELKK